MLLKLVKPEIYKSSDFCALVSGLPDDFVRLEEQRWGNREPKRLDDLGADAACDLGWPLHGQVGRRDTFLQELIHGGSGTTDSVLVSPYTSSVPCAREVLQRRRHATRRTPRRDTSTQGLQRIEKCQQRIVVRLWQSYKAVQCIHCVRRPMA